MPKNIVIALDTASDDAGVALAQDGALLDSHSWNAHQSHSRDLLPALDALLSKHNRMKDDIAGVCVCLGPGSYAGLRVGVSTAKALAYALDVPLAGVGRLAAQAYDVAMSSGARVIPIHAAGRAELAWAVYEADGDDLRELEAPHLGPRDALVDAISKGDIVIGDAKDLTDELREALASTGADVRESQPGRVVGVAKLGLKRLARGEIDNPDTLVPLYLRAPAIGPPKSTKSS